MSITLRVQPESELATIAISGRFDYYCHDEFRQVLSQIHSWPERQFEVDLTGVAEMDSSALGMLLLLRDQVAKPQLPVRITGANPATRRVLEIANFKRYFAIE